MVPKSGARKFHDYDFMNILLLQNPCGHQISRVCMNLLTSSSTSSVPCIICDSPCLAAHATIRKTSFLSIPPHGKMEQESKLEHLPGPQPHSMTHDCGYTIAFSLPSQPLSGDYPPFLEPWQTSPEALESYFCRKTPHGMELM